MLSALDDLGRVGLTAIGDSVADAQRRYDHACGTLLRAAGTAVAA